jgi:flagellar basal body-associated protein FliL
MNQDLENQTSDVKSNTKLLMVVLLILIIIMLLVVLIKLFLTF